MSQNARSNKTKPSNKKWWLIGIGAVVLVATVALVIKSNADKTPKLVITVEDRSCDCIPDPLHIYDDLSYVSEYAYGETKTEGKVKGDFNISNIIKEIEAASPDKDKDKDINYGIIFPDGRELLVAQDECPQLQTFINTIPNGDRIFFSDWEKISQ